ncbi:hypothetical protein FB107DRAFT_280149 [Schizophyllum commune]
MTRNRRRRARAPSAKNAEGVGYPYPLARDQKEALRAQVAFSAGLKPPEACTRSLGRRKRQGWATPTYSRGAVERCCVFMDAYFIDFCGPPTAGGMRARPRAPPFKRLETDIFDEKDSSPSSLPTSSRFMPTSQLSTTLNDA